MNKLKLNLYQTFYPSKSSHNIKKNYNDILKGTKSILKNNFSYKSYINEYKDSTEVVSFKSPDIQNYPLVNRNSLSLIPILKTTKNLKQKKKRKKIRSQMNNIIFSYGEILSDNNNNNKKKNNNISCKYSLNKRLKIGLKNLKLKYIKDFYDKKDNYENSNPIISDFFYKWTQEYQFDIKNPILNNYSSLSYNEKKIFYSNYDDLLKEKLEYIKKNKITNLEEKIESEFVDVKERKIKLELNSIKLIFKQINENNFEIGEEQVINLPLSFVFLFYIDGFNFFKKILLTSIHFSNNFNQVNFKDKNIYSLIKKIFKNDSDYQSIFKNIKNKNNEKLKEEDFSIDSDFKIKRSMTVHRKTRNESKKISKKYVLSNDNSRIKKNVKIIHANKELQKKEMENEKNTDHSSIIKENTYDEFEFIWETPFKTYKVTLQLPIIQLWCEHLQKTVITFCEKNFFLFLFKNNFINWDFYAMHYFFSIKYFRHLVLKKYSYKVKPLLRTLYSDKRNDSQYYEDNSEDIKISSLFNKVLYTRNKRISNLLNENNESFTFFYTDNFSINSIIDFHSYSIIIDYNELNPNKIWKFYLTFKQMKFLIQIKKYELLKYFLPKIIKTNFEVGNLEMDFTVFDDFNWKILNYKKKEVINKYKWLDDEKYNKKEKMKLEIKNPYIIIEKNVDGISLPNILEEIEISPELLNKFRKIKNNYSMTKIILKMIQLKNKENNLDEKDEFDINFLKNNIDEMIEMNNKGKIERNSRTIHFKSKPKPLFKDK